MLVFQALAEHKRIVNRYPKLKSWFDQWDMDQGINYNNIEIGMLEALIRSPKEQCLWRQLNELPTHDDDAEERRILLRSNPQLQEVLQ